MLLAFHIGDTVVHLDEWWNQEVDIDFDFLQPEHVAVTLCLAKFTIEATTRRVRYPDSEHPSERAYILARTRDC